MKTALLVMIGPCFPVRSPAEHSNWLVEEQPASLLWWSEGEREGEREEEREGREGV